MPPAGAYEASTSQRSYGTAAGMLLPISCVFQNREEPGGAPADPAQAWEPGALGTGKRADRPVTSQVVPPAAAPGPVLRRLGPTRMRGGMVSKAMLLMSLFNTLLML